VVDCHFLEQHEKIEKEHTDSDITTMPIFHNELISTKWMTFSLKDDHPKILRKF
jgi:hypothetical protein